MFGNTIGACNENNSYTLRPIFEKVMLRSTYESYLLLIIQPIIATIGISLNILLLAVIAKNKDMRNITNIYLGHLAVSDTLYLAFFSTTSFISAVTSPFSIDWHYLGPGGCTLVYFMYYVTYHFSLFNVTLISIERYLAICFPLVHKKIASKSRTKKLVGGCWAFSLLVASGLVLFRGYESRTCWSMRNYDGYYRKTTCVRFPIMIKNIWFPCHTNCSCFRACPFPDMFSQ